jgi:hypothetical protein
MVSEGSIRALGLSGGGRSGSKASSAMVAARLPASRCVGHGAGEAQELARRSCRRVPSRHTTRATLTHSAGT